MDSVISSTDAPPKTCGRIETAAIHLPGGWRGKVTVALHDGPSEHRLPDASQWRAVLQSFVTDPFSLADGTTLKFVPGAEVLRGTFAHGGGTLTVIAKHHTAEGLGGHLSILLRGSRARRNFERAAKLACSGVATALPLAMIERARPARESWLVTAYVPDLVDLDRMALAVLPHVHGSDGARIKRRIGQAVVTLLLRLAQGGWHHRDLKASNILLRHHDRNDEPMQAWIVDLDGLSRAASSDVGRDRQRLVRLTASLMDYASITRTDMARFLRSYLAAAEGQREWRLEFRQLAQNAKRYAEHSKRRKGHKLDGYAGD